MNPREISDNAFDQIADEQLRILERSMEAFDPDELEATLAGDVLTLVLGDGTKIIINRHRAARQMWMAATRKAWHFDHTGSAWVTTPGNEELINTLELVLTQQLRRPIELPKARKR